MHRKIFFRNMKLKMFAFIRKKGKLKKYSDKSRYNFQQSCFVIISNYVKKIFSKTFILFEIMRVYC